MHITLIALKFAKMTNQVSLTLAAFFVKSEAFPYLRLRYNAGVGKY